MRMDRRTLGICLVIATAATGCGRYDPEKCAPPSSSGAEASASEGPNYEGPIGSTDVAQGKELFSSFCDDCHPDGGEDVGPSLIDNPHEPPKLRQQIREGSGKMRPIPENRLSNEEMEAVLAYLASINAVK